jgi:DNA polymerase-3 subunit alpha (Gram-positive type)
MLKTLHEVINEENNLSIAEALKNTYIKKVSINKSSNSWDIFLSSNNELSENHIKTIKDVLSSKFQISGNINIIFEKAVQSPITLDHLRDNREDFKRIIGEVFEQNPSVNCLLQSCKYEVINNKLVIYINNSFFFSVLNAKNAKQLLEKHLKNQYKLDVKIKFIETQEEILNYNTIKDQEDKKLILEYLNNSYSTDKSTKPKENTSSSKPENKSDLIYGKKLQGDRVDILSLSEESGNVVVCGEVFSVELKETKNGKYIFMFNITDYTSSIKVKFFPKPDIIDNIKSKIKDGVFLKVQGEVINDSFAREPVIMASAIAEYSPVKREDTAEEKRVELHLHTQMSSMDGASSATSLIKRAKEWGHKAIAITDHGVVQAFPEAMEASAKTGVKVIYGVEAYLVDDGEPIVLRPCEHSIDDEFIIFDIETTGFNPQTDEITEIGAVKIKGCKIIDRFSTLINPEKEIPQDVVNLTGITNEMVRDKETIKTVLPKFLKFIGDSPVVAHNAKFDTGFIREKSKKLGLSIL